VSEGPALKVGGPPRTFAKSQTHPPADFFFLPFFLGTFLGVSRQGEFKNTTKNVFAKSPCRKFSPKKTTKTPMSVFPRLFLVLSRFRVLRSDGSSKTLQKTVYKKSCRKVFTKKSTKNQKSIFWAIFFNHVFGRFSVSGVQKHHNKRKSIGKREK
jgi:hypothetical protein